MSTKSDLDAIRARLVAATPGPWKASRPVAGETFIGIHQEPEDWDGMGYQSIGGVRVRGKGSLAHAHHERHLLGNAALIAHAPTDLAALCDEVEALRREGADLIDSQRIRAEMAEREVEALRRQVADMRAIVSAQSAALRPYLVRGDETLEEAIALVFNDGVLEAANALGMSVGDCPALWNLLHPESL